ncbi:uncharacterized protein LOC128243353 isoform X2 [Mya arenaria]|uniref:uncharacterized protein LOC128243353 isoform X2 n=1 Tax=Mya arenaria TaxID=6604 RepID=UPI0022DEA69D|nr:uncharacterized protein LOC128243353 isoform X2 [Mya arenaria]
MANKNIGESQNKVYTNFVNDKPWVNPEVPPKASHVPSYPGTNAGALFGFDVKRKSLNNTPIKPPVKESYKDNTATQNANTYPINKDDSGGINNASNHQDNKTQAIRIDSGACTALERGLHNIQSKVDAVDKKAEDLDDSYKTVPVKFGEVQSKMAYKSSQVEELDRRNKVHSAKIHELERALKNVKMENETIRGRAGPGGSMGPIAEDGYQNGYGSPRGYQPDPYQDRDQPPQPAKIQDREPMHKPDYKNDQYGHAHHGGGGPGEEPYWGFNRYYDPQFLTAYRREHVPYQTKQDEREQEEEWRRKKQEEEEKILKDKPKTYDYTAPYQSLYPPRDINKYFHDSKYLDERPEPKPDEYYFNDDIPMAPAHGTQGTTYERDYDDPRKQGPAEPSPGGLYIIRFHDTGFSEVNLSLKEQQTIIRSNGGYVLGISRKHNVIALEGDAGWRYSRDQNPRPQVRCRHQLVDDAIAVIWFPSEKKAFDFFSNSFRNRFRQEGFPSPHGWEGHFIPLLNPPFLRNLDTYMVIEILNAGRANPEKQRSIQQFEAETRQAILRYMPNSIPFIASATKALTRGEYFKPGTLCRDKSKIFISRFDSMAEMSELWSSGLIQDALHKGNITGPVNVFAFSLKDWQDH